MYIEQLTHLRNLADAADRRSGSPGHSQRVHVYARALLEALGVYGSEAHQILVAAYLHDIGKVLIPERILRKREPLSADEWAMIKKHPESGADMLMTHTALAAAALTVRSHHERPDGRGYPYGLAGPSIPSGARIISVADSFDAMVTSRPYRTGMSVAAAAQCLRMGAGVQWDATVAMAFLDCVVAHLDCPPAMPEEARTGLLTPVAGLLAMSQPEGQRRVAV